MAYGDLPAGAPHKPNKGMEGGACNRERCQAEPALYYNHGMYKWYCGDCARDIGQDVVNKRDWELRWKPECGHDQFETREEIDARGLMKLAQAAHDLAPKVERSFRNVYRDLPGQRPKSSSLQRLLKAAKR